MTLKELVDTVDTADVDAALRAAYPKMGEADVRAHIDVMRLLRRMEPKPDPSAQDDDPVTHIEVRLRIDEGVWYDVHGRSASGTSWAIEFVRWDQWLLWDVRPVGCDLTPAALLAHCLYEMTFFGFVQQDVLDHKEALFDRIDEAKAMLDEEDGA